MDPSSFTVMSLCAGIGGLDLGLRLAIPSARTVCVVEREAFAIAHLVQKMEDGHLDPAPIWTDLTRFDGKAWRGVVDCIIGGYPCQPFSVAGRRAGTDDPRHLFPHIARIIAEVQPAVVFFENVDAHLTLGFEEVGERLQALGYIVAAGVFSASEVGAPHRRKRLFILAHKHDDRRESERGGGVFDRIRQTFGNDVDRRSGAAELEHDSSERRAAQRSESEVWGGRDAFARSSGTVENADDEHGESRPMHPRKRPEGHRQREHCQFGQSNKGLENAERIGRRGRSYGDARGGGRQIQAARPCSECDGAVADACGSREERESQCSNVESECETVERSGSSMAEGTARRGGEPVRHSSGEDGRMADTCVLPWEDATTGSDEGAAASFTGGSHAAAPSRDALSLSLSLSPWPPRPNEYERWAEVPEDLQPATQPALRGMADGNASRVDRLRALGNGVVPLVAAVAFRTLAKDLGLL